MGSYDRGTGIRLSLDKIAAISKIRPINYTEILPGSRAPSNTIQTLAWSPLGNYVATGASDRKLRVWNPERSHVKQSTELRGHVGSVEKVAWNPLKEAELATVGTDGTVRVWDVRTKSCVATVKGEKEEQFVSLVWSAEGSEIVAGTKDDTFYRISRTTSSILSTHTFPTPTNCLIASNSGSELLLAHSTGAISILDYPSFSTLHTFRAHASSLTALDFSPDGRTLAVGGLDSLLTLWDTSSINCKRSIDRFNGPIRSVSFSWCGGYVIATTEVDKTIEVSHVDSGEMVAKIEAGKVSVAQFAPRNYSIAYVCHDAGNSGLKIVNAADLAP